MSDYIVIVLNEDRADSFTKGTVTFTKTESSESTYTYTATDTIINIPPNLFFYDINLLSIIIPNNIFSIGNNAFKGCSSLSTLEIPSNIKIIGDSAFSYCSGLLVIYIPLNSITTIGPSVFKGCSGLNTVLLPTSITTIGNSAFEDCTGLTTMTIPTTATAIGDSAFKGCTSLVYISIPGSVVSIGNSVFQNCSALTTLTIPSQVVSIGSNLCSGCSKLTIVLVSSRVNYIGTSAFQDCVKLESIIFQSSLNTFGTNAFLNCTLLNKITVPRDITNIGTTIFNGCPIFRYMEILLPDETIAITNIPIYVYTNTNYPSVNITTKTYSNINKSNTITIEDSPDIVINTDTNTYINNLNCDIITQLRRSRNATKVPVRFELTSPYPQYTQAQLDMRRKAEILQYKANNQNTKQNGLTRPQLFSQLVNNPRVSSASSIQTRKVCDKEMLPVPTTFSDIPGPVQNIYRDESIPLYNFNTIRNYNLLQTISTTSWDIFYYTDVETSSTDDKTIMSIYIRDSIPTTTTSFALTTPIMINVSGVNNNNTDYDIDFSRNTVSVIVSKIVLQIHYNSTLVKTITINNPTNSQSETKITNMYLNTTNSADTPFSASVFIGNLYVSNIQLYTPPNIIYDINILTDITLTTGSDDYGETSYFNNITYTATTNPVDTTNTSYNCVAYSDTT